MFEGDPTRIAFLFFQSLLFQSTLSFARSELKTFLQHLFLSERPFESSRRQCAELLARIHSELRLHDGIVLLRGLPEQLAAASLPWRFVNVFFRTG